MFIDFKFLTRKIPGLVSLVHLLVAAQNSLVRRILLRGFNLDEQPHVRLGSSWGGWWIPLNFVASARDLGVISCGLGPDISFDLAINEFGFDVYGVECERKWLDSHVECGDLPSRVFFVEATVGNGSGKTIGLHELILDAKRVLNKDKFMLKMDIEGAEIFVLRQLENYHEYLPVIVFELDYLSLIRFMNVRESQAFQGS